MKKPWFEDVLGANRGVVAYANRGWTKENLGFMEVYGITTGIKYQCVEYARRWLVIVKSLKFSDVPIATDIWSLKTVENIYTKQKYPLTQIPNGSGSPPTVGSILIYNNTGRLPWGHVAIIVFVSPCKSFIHIAEQNEFDHFWEGDYSRELRVLVDENYRILDKYPVLGWLTYPNS